MVCGEVIDVIKRMLRREKKTVCIRDGNWGLYSYSEWEDWFTDLQLC